MEIPTQITVAALDFGVIALIAFIAIMVIALVAYQQYCPKCKRFDLDASGVERGGDEEWYCKHCHHQEWREVRSTEPGA